MGLIFKRDRLDPCEMAKRISYRPHDTTVVWLDSNPPSYCIQIRRTETDSRNIKREVDRTGFYEWIAYTEDEVIEGFKQAVMNFEVHEACEWILIDGERLFNPHVIGEPHVSVVHR